MRVNGCKLHLEFSVCLLHGGQYFQSDRAVYMDAGAGARTVFLPEPIRIGNEALSPLSGRKSQGTSSGDGLRLTNCYLCILRMFSLSVGWFLTPSMSTLYYRDLNSDVSNLIHLFWCLGEAFSPGVEQNTALPIIQGR